MKQNESTILGGLNWTKLKSFGQVIIRLKEEIANFGFRQEIFESINSWILSKQTHLFESIFGYEPLADKVTKCDLKKINLIKTYFILFK